MDGLNVVCRVTSFSRRLDPDVRAENLATTCV